MKNEAEFFTFLNARLDEEEGLARLLIKEQGMMPAKVLRGVKADRRIIAKYEQAKVWYSERPWAPAGELYGLCTAIAIRAERFDRHPDYRNEWRP